MAEIARALEQDLSFAAIAVELRLGEFSIAEMSFAAAILSMIRADNLYRLDRLAADIGMEPETARRIVLNEQRFVALIAESHRLFKAMIPYEGEIRGLIAQRPDGGTP